MSSRVTAGLLKPQPWKPIPLFFAQFYHAKVIPDLCGRRLSKGTNAK